MEGTVTEAENGTDAEIDKAVQEAEKPLKDLQRVLMANLADRIQRSRDLTRELQAVDEDVKAVRGAIAEMSDLLAEKKALHGAKLKERDAVLTEQGVFGDLWLGERGRSKANPSGLTLQQALDQDLDGIRKLIQAP